MHLAMYSNLFTKPLIVVSNNKSMLYTNPATSTPLQHPPLTLVRVIFELNCFQKFNLSAVLYKAWLLYKNSNSPRAVPYPNLPNFFRCAALVQDIQSRGM